MQISNNLSNDLDIFGLCQLLSIDTVNYKVYKDQKTDICNKQNTQCTLR